MSKIYTEEEVIELTKEAVGLWRIQHDKKLYQSEKYFGKWIKNKLIEIKELDEYRKNIRNLADNKSDIPFTQR